jgi:hypothetical protein
MSRYRAGVFLRKLMGVYVDQHPMLVSFVFVSFRAPDPFGLISDRIGLIRLRHGAAQSIALSAA